MVWKLRRAFSAKESQREDEVVMPEVLYQMKESFEEYFHQCKKAGNSEYNERDAPFYNTL